MSEFQSSGGFFAPKDSLPSPPASTSASSTAGGPLPSTRTRPLLSNSRKEWMYIDYVEKQTARMQRRLDKHKAKEDEALDGTAGAASTDNDAGYASFRELGRDADNLIDVIWVSATPSLQVSQLLTLTGVIFSAIPAFAPAPRTMFGLLDKLDIAFKSLITGKDLETGAVLPGFQQMGQRITATEKVRINSVVQRGKFLVFNLMDKGDEIDEEEMAELARGDDQIDEAADDAYYGDWAVETGRVFVRTMGELGDTLGQDGPIGIISDESVVYDVLKKPATSSE